jgi:two-component system, LytTR family, sensor kinase
MWRTNRKIGFDDRLVTVIMIPVASFIIPIIFFGMGFRHEPYFTWNVYLSTLIMTTVIWLGNRYIMIWARSRYPHFDDIRKRLLVQSMIMLIYTVASNNILGALLDFCGLKDFHHSLQGRGITDIITASNGAALFSSLTVVAIYESIYFMNELRKSVEEKEMLKLESLYAQLEALKTQVNPHFLFNNLNTLVSIIPEDPDRAVAFVQQLARVYRHILEVKDEQSIPLKEELDVLRAYAFLLKTRFGDNIEINIDVPEEKMNRKIIPLSLQILMENAIKHNIVSGERPLRIDVFAQNGRLIVSNNLQKKNQLNESTGIGLENIRNRYRLLSDKHVVVTENSSDFTVSIPLIEY